MPVEAHIKKRGRERKDVGHEETKKLAIGDATSSAMSDRFHPPSVDCIELTDKQNRATTSLRISSMRLPRCHL